MQIKIEPYGDIFRVNLDTRQVGFAVRTYHDACLAANAISWASDEPVVTIDYHDCLPAETQAALKRMDIDDGTINHAASTEWNSGTKE